MEFSNNGTYPSSLQLSAFQPCLLELNSPSNSSSPGRTPELMLPLPERLLPAERAKGPSATTCIATLLGALYVFFIFSMLLGLFHINFLAALDVKTLGETFERTVADAHALEVEDGS